MRHLSLLLAVVQAAVSAALRAVVRAAVSAVFRALFPAVLRAAFLTISVSGALAGCGPRPEAVADGADPLAALSVTVPTHRWDTTFWARQEHRKTALWHDARAFCLGRDRAVFPNCAHVQRVLFLEEPPPLPVLPLAPVVRAIGEFPPLSPARPTQPGVRR